VTAISVEKKMTNQKYLVLIKLNPSKTLPFFNILQGMNSTPMEGVKMMGAYKCGSFCRGKNPLHRRRNRHPHDAGHNSKRIHVSKNDRFSILD
jgi:hypothetical protein